MFRMFSIAQIGHRRYTPKKSGSAVQPRVRVTLRGSIALEGLSFDRLPSASSQELEACLIGSKGLAPQCRLVTVAEISATVDSVRLKVLGTSSTERCEKKHEYITYVYETLTVQWRILPPYLHTCTVCIHPAASYIMRIRR